MQSHRPPDKNQAEAASLALGQAVLQLQVHGSDSELAVPGLLNADLTIPTPASHLLGDAHQAVVATCTPVIQVDDNQDMLASQCLSARGILPIPTTTPVSHLLDGAHQVVVATCTPVVQVNDDQDMLASQREIFSVPEQYSLTVNTNDVDTPAIGSQGVDGVHQVLDVPASHQGSHEVTATGQQIASQLRLVCQTAQLQENDCVLDPDAAVFRMRDKNLVHRGILHPDLQENWDHVQQVQAGGVGFADEVITGSWDTSKIGSATSCTGTLHAQSEPVLPFQQLEDIPAFLGLAPKQVHKVNSLPDLAVTMPTAVFMDKLLPAPASNLKANDTFTADYYIALHNISAAPGMRGDGSTYPAYTPNHIGARVKLPHVGLKVDRWRHHLTGYEDAEVVQFVEFGFPLGLSDQPDLECATRNHGSAYIWYQHVDKFICSEVEEGGMSGPFLRAPWWNTIISPLMTAHKKVRSRRTVFDATFGERSLNNSTPSDLYMGLPCKYTFPKIQDFKEMILTCGPGAYMYKRDLSRFFLQLPLDPSEFHRVGVIWRGLFFFFVGLAFGLRH